MSGDLGSRVDRAGLARLLQSLLAAELAEARGRQGQSPASLPIAWPDDLRLDDGPGGLGCDSLERLWLSSAVNRMFHRGAENPGLGVQAEARFGSWLDGVAAAWRADGAEVTFATSGSTGRPKLCTHKLSDLDTEVAFLAELFADRRRIVALTPAHHIYGCLFTVMLPARLGIEVLDATSLPAGRLRQALRPGDLVVSFPERWRWLDRSLADWPADVQGIVSTAPCPPDLIASLAAHGLARMTEIYGASETAGLATRTWPELAYRLMPHWSFVEETDLADPTLVHRCGRRVTPMDRMLRQGGGAFTLAGRSDGMVQVGGINVDPGAVAGALTGLPGVAAAAVRLMGPHEGTRLKAFIVPAGEPAGLQAAIETWVRETLPAPQRPTSLTFGPALPVGPLGKLADWAIEADGPSAP